MRRTTVGEVVSILLIAALPGILAVLMHEFEPIRNLMGIIVGFVLLAIVVCSVYFACKYLSDNNYPKWLVITVGITVFISVLMLFHALYSHEMVQAFHSSSLDSDD
ncbi:MAG: hypothetical protein V4555_14980 [Acidobacteriota bacterium]